MIKKYKGIIMVTTGVAILVLDLLGIKGAVTLAIGIILIIEGMDRI